MKPLVLASTLTATYPQFIARDSLLQNNWTRRIPGTLKTKQKCLLPVFCIYTCLWTIIVSQKMQCNYKLLCIGFIFLHIGNNKNKALKKFLKIWKVEYYITNPRTEPDQKLFLHCSWIHMPMNLLQAIFSLVWTGKLNLIYTYHTFVH